MQNENCHIYLRCFRISYIFAAFAFPWKVLVAFVPPPELMAGWPCFVTALGLIGSVTAVVGASIIFVIHVDLAPVLGHFLLLTRGRKGLNN